MTQESRKRKGYDNGELHEYWTKDPEGLAKWASSPHPWTELHKHLKKYIKNPHIAKATTSAWYKDVFGHMPNEGKKDRSAMHATYWASGQPTQRVGMPPFAKGASFTKGKAVDDMTMEECQAAYDKALADGDHAMAAKLKAKMAAMQGDDDDADDDDDERGQRAKFGEGPGGSQKGPSIKAIKAQIAQAREDGDEEMVKALEAKLAKLQGGSGGRAADPRALARSLPVIRSAHGGGMAPTLTDEPSEDERATAPGGGVFVRASYRAGRDDENSHIMTLRFSQFNNWYEIDSAREGKFLERVAPGAFTKTIGERGGQIKVLFNHGHDNQIGEKILGKIVTLEERKDGAYAEIEMFDTSYNRDLIPGLRAGAYGSSFMFNVMDDAWEDRPERSESNPSGLPERTVRALRLLEFGPVTWPANPGTTAGLRSDTDTYCDGLRATAPDVYNDLEEQFGEFRSALPSTSSYEGAVETDTPGDDEAAFRADAPVGDHVAEVNTNSAETRRARLELAGIVRTN